MELRHLRYFLAEAEHLNFGRAAPALHTAQPSLRQQIRGVEREGGGPLFERTKRYVALTPLGQTMLGEALAIVESADRLTVNLRDSSGTPHGRLRVGAISPAMIGVVPRYLPTFRSAYPMVDITVDSVPLDEQPAALIERRIDIGILRAPVEDDAIATVPIVNESYCIALPSNHRLAAQSSVAVTDLRGETLISLRGGLGGSFNDGAAAYLRRHNVHVTSLDASDILASYAMVASNVGMMMASTIVSTLGFEGVTYRRLTPRRAVGTLILACRRDRRAVATIAAFIDHATAMNLDLATPP